MAFTWAEVEPGPAFGRIDGGIDSCISVVGTDSDSSDIVSNETNRKAEAEGVAASTGIATAIASKSSE